MTDRIEKSIDLAAPIDRVWRALTDHNEFGAWFGVKLDGPFELNEISTGHITYPGYEHVKWEAKIVRMEPPKLFAFTWHPYAIDPAVDYSSEPATMVEFELGETLTGTRLIVVETGFEALPPHRQPDCLRMNTSGWEEQLRRIAAHVGG